MPITAKAIDIVNDALIELGLPSVAVGAVGYDTTGLQAVAMLNALGDELIRVHDWQFLERTLELVADGINDAYPLPSDFGRTVNQTQWSTSDKRPMMGPDSPQIWSWNQFGIAAVGVYYRYRILNNKFTMFPLPSAGQEFAFYYISKNWVMDAEDNSILKDRVSKEGDIPVFDRRLLVTGLKAKLWAQKGFETTKIQQEFNYMLDVEKAQTQGARVIDLSGCSGHFYLNGDNLPDTGYGV